MASKRRAYILYATAVLACVASICLTAITIRISTLFVTRPVRGTALGASVLDVLSLAALLIVVAFGVRSLSGRRHSNRRQNLLLVVPTVVLSAVAGLMTIYILGWADDDRRIHDIDNYSLEQARSLSRGGFALWVVSVLSQAAFYIAWLLSPRSSVADYGNAATETRPSPTRSMKRSLSVHLHNLTPPPPPFFRSASAPISPTLSAFSPSPRSSIRHSMHQVIRPVTSKTKLLIGQKFSSQDSKSLYSERRVSLETMHLEDGFESWDTSGIDARDAVNQVIPRSRLEPIPQSRPASPAHALEGPFLEDRSPEDTPLPESPLQSPVSPSSDAGSLHGFPLPPSRRPSAGASDQSHIHPLFRTDSPTPPPAASPGTVVTASPFGGQMITDPAVQNFTLGRIPSAHGSRPSSPSPLSPMRSRPGSSKSVRSPLVEQTPTPPLPQMALARTNSVQGDDSV